MSKIRKTLSVLLALLVVMTSISAFGTVGMADAGPDYSYTHTSGDWGYEINDDGTVTIKKYLGNDSNVIVPGVIDGKKVVDFYCAFWHSKINTITIPDSINNIEDGAFYECLNITSVTVSPQNANYSSKDGVLFDKEQTTLLYYPVSNTNKSYVIPDSVTEIGKYAFEYCKSLTSVTIPDSVTNIGYSAFRGCSSLTSVTIPDSVTGIEEYAFEGCTALVSINIGNNVTSIDEYTFSYCSSLTSIEIPDGVTSIESSAFEGCKSLVSVEIPDSVKEIGWSAFRNCSLLTSIEIPDSVTEIGNMAFWETAWYNNQPYGLVYAGKVAYDYKGDMPENTKIVLKTGTKGIAGSAFYGCTALIGIEIPDSVTNIGDSAFSGCKSLSIEIPDSVTSIGRGAFSNCTSLTSIEISDSVTNIYASTFENCKSLTSVTISDSVTNIGYDAFKGCTSLTSIEIPDSVTEIGSGVFSACTSLTNIDVSSKNANYSSIDGILFNKDKTELIMYPEGRTDKTYKIPDSVTSIGESAFEDCELLASIEIPDSVTEIGEYAFLGTAWYDNQPDGLVYAGKVAYKYKGNMPENTKITLKPGTKVIEKNAFEDCTSLTSVTIPDSVTNIGYSAFRGCSSLTSVTIPDSVTGIEEYAFNGCTALASVEIPDSVTSIGWGAFSNCTALASVKIPDSVTRIEYNAFYGCKSLKNVTVPKSVTKIGERSLGYIYDNIDKKLDGFTISGYKNTAAEKYATKNGFKFIALDDEPTTAPTTEPRQPAADLSVGDCSASPNLNNGDKSTLYAVIRNSGDLNFKGEITVIFTVDGKTIDKVNYTNQIDSSKSIRVKSTKQWSAWFGSHVIKAQVKVNGGTVDSDLANNILKTRVKVADN